MLSLVTVSHCQPTIGFFHNKRLNTGWTVGQIVAWPQSSCPLLGMAVLARKECPKIPQILHTHSHPNHTVHYQTHILHYIAQPRHCSDTYLQCTMMGLLPVLLCISYILFSTFVMVFRLEQVPSGLQLVMCIWKTW